MSDPTAPSQHLFPHGRLAASYIYVHGIDAAIDRITASGGALVRPPYPEGDLRVATVTDPAGNIIGIWQQGPR